MQLAAAFQQMYRRGSAISTKINRRQGIIGHFSLSCSTDNGSNNSSRIPCHVFRTWKFHGVILRHMFLNGSADGPFTNIRVLIDEEDTFRYPIFTTKLPANELAIVRHIWTVMNDLFAQSRYRGQLEDCINEPVKFLVTIYVTWAYTHILRNLDARPTNSQNFTLTIYDNFKNVFSADSIIRQCEATPTKFTMRISNKPVRARDIFNATVKDASSPFAHRPFVRDNIEGDIAQIGKSH